MARPPPLREYIPQLMGLNHDGSKQLRCVPIGNSLSPWRKWREEDELGELNWTGLPSVDLKVGHEAQQLTALHRLSESGLKLFTKALWRRF